MCINFLFRRLKILLITLNIARNFTQKKSVKWINLASNRNRIYWLYIERRSFNYCTVDKEEVFELGWRHWSNWDIALSDVEDEEDDGEEDDGKKTLEETIKMIRSVGTFACHRQSRKKFYWEKCETVTFTFNVMMRNGFGIFEGFV